MSATLQTLYERDEAICWLCHRFVERDDASRDHIIPRSLGGPNNIDNYALAHAECNSRRGNDKSLPSTRAMIGILRKCQQNRCGVCSKSGRQLSHIFRAGRSLKVVCVVCDFNHGANKMHKPKAIKIHNKGNAMEMTVLDTIRAFQIETGDLVGFHYNGMTRTGTVQSFEDNGDTIDLKLIDDNEGDVVGYTVDANLNISILGQEAVAI